MIFKRLVFFLFIIFSVVSCMGSSDDITVINSRQSDYVIPVSYEAVENYASFIDGLKSGYDDIMNAEERTFENTVTAFYDIYKSGSLARGYLNFILQTSADADVRELASRLVLDMVTWYFGVASDPALHEAVALFSGRAVALTPSESETLENVEKLLGDYGYGMSGADRASLVSNLVQTQVLEQQINYLDTMGDPQNLIPELFAEYIKLKAAYAGYFGYDNYAEYKISVQMPDSVAEVESFLLEGISRLREAYGTFSEKFNSIKAEIKGNPDAVVYLEERQIYLDYIIEAEYGLENFNKTFFEQGHYSLKDTLDTIFYIYDEYFDIKFVEADPPGELWHEDVRYFEMVDKNTGEPLSSCYMDLYARTGKVNASQIYQLSGAYTDENGVYVRPQLVFLMSFNKGADDSPVMLSTSKTLTMFHESGHLLQRTMSSASPSAELSESFSQFFEEFFYEKDIADRLLGAGNSWNQNDFENFLKAIAAYELDQRMAFFSDYIADLRLFSEYGAGDDIDVLTVYDSVENEYFMTRFMPNSAMRDPLTSLIYSSSLYAYGWSLGIALDIADFVRSRGGLLNKTNTLMLKNSYYALSKPLDSEAVIRSVLGRDWNMDAFYEYYGAE